MRGQYLGHPDQRWGHISYAQHGDDFMVLNLFEMMGIDQPSYLDLGAHDPTVISNTKLLYDRGSRGINVEANPVLYEKFKKERPEDINLNLAVGAVDSRGTLFRYSETSGRNTMDEFEVKNMEGVLSVKDEIEVGIISLQTLLESYWTGDYPQFLSCDIEGWDYLVLSRMNFKHGVALPYVVCVETRRKDTLKMTVMMGGNGYERYCRMGENLFFVRRDFMNKVF